MPQDLKTYTINLKSLDQDISDPVITGGGDVYGRTLRVIFSQEAWAQMTSKTKVYLKWRHKQLDVRGYNVFRQVSEEPCVWEITWPAAMLHKGDVLACIELVDPISVAPSVNFIIHVLEDPIGTSGMRIEDDFSEFQKAVLRLQDLEEKIQKIESLEMIQTSHDYVSKYDVGGYSNGDRVPKGLTFDRFVRYLITGYQNMKYISPVTSLSVNEYDITPGKTGTISLSLTFTQNDAGPIKSVDIICKNNASLQVNTTFDSHGTGPNNDVYQVDATFLVPKSVVELCAQVKYDDGPIKNDEFGDPIPGRIEEGVSETNVIGVSGIKYDGYYCVKTSSEKIPDTYENFPLMQSLTRVVLIGGDIFEFDIPDGGKFAIYIPKETLSDPASEKIRSWEYRKGKEWVSLGAPTNFKSDWILTPLGYYWYQSQIPVTNEQQSRVRITL